MQNLAHDFWDKVNNFNVNKLIDFYEEYKSSHQEYHEKTITIKNELENLGFVSHNKKFLEKIKFAVESLQKNQRRIILIVGETGSGKTFLARQMHKIALRTTAEPTIVHCSHLGKDVNTIRDYLFGHKAGAFTGADKKKEGIFDTPYAIILDDIQHITNDAQKILLEVLQDWVFSPFGDEKTKKIVTARVIVTSTLHPDDLLKIGFLEEFINRISSEIILIPPLRERTKDIPFLIKQFASKYNEKDIRFDPQLMEYITFKLNFQNIRKLHQFIDNLIVHADNNYISFDTLRKILSTTQEKNEMASVDLAKSIDSEFDLENEILKIRHIYITKALEKFHGNIYKASRALGYKNHNGLLHWIKKLDINVNSFK